MKFAIMGLALGTVLVVGSAVAQNSGQGSMSAPMSGTMGKSTHHMGMSNPSLHSMPATVTSVDQKTGLIEVNTAGMGLKLHFPPASLANVKAGDAITLQMGFSKP